MIDIKNNLVNDGFRQFIDSIKGIDKISVQYFYTDSEFLESSKLKTPNPTFVSLRRINDIRYINKFLIQINENINDGNSIIGYLETFTARRERLSINKIPIIGKLYFFIEFLFKRFIPKISFLKNIYFSITKGKNRFLSKAEVLGRLVYCGFELKEIESINGFVFFRAQKKSSVINNTKPSYALLIKLPRVGKNGKLINVYKFRTMHPYSEFLQEYVLAQFGYANTGKLKNDFRLTPWGKLMRKYWIDELPQLYNILKGEMKLVGVRPTSKTYFDQIPHELQEMRTRFKPGCIPPYVSRNEEPNVASVLQSEKNYLLEKIKHPYTTDIKYLFFAIYNILVKGKRSA